MPVGGHLHGTVIRRRLLTPAIGRRNAAEAKGTALVDMPLVQDTFTPMAVMLMGPRGRGKTLALNALGDVMRRRYEARGFACKVYANFPTIDADVADPKIMQKVTNWSNTEIRDGLLLADEVQGEAASVKWNTNTNFELVQTLTQIRKKMLENAFTTQYPRGIEKGLLEQVDYFVEVRKLGDGYGLVFAIHDWKDLLTERPRRYRPFPPFWWEADWYWVWFGTKQYFGHYATLGRQIPRYMAAKNPELWERLTQEEWRRQGYALPPVEQDENLESWAETQDSGRITVPRIAASRPTDWKDLLRSMGEFSVSGMWAQLSHEVPEARTMVGFRKALQENGFILRDGFGYAQ
jgi:hypothetical protein